MLKNYAGVIGEGLQCIAMGGAGGVFSKAVFVSLHYGVLQK